VSSAAYTKLARLAVTNVYHLKVRLIEQLKSEARTHGVARGIYQKNMADVLKVQDTLVKERDALAQEVYDVGTENGQLLTKVGDLVDQCQALDASSNRAIQANAYLKSVMRENDAIYEEGRTRARMLGTKLTTALRELHVLQNATDFLKQTLKLAGEVNLEYVVTVATLVTQNPESVPVKTGPGSEPGIDENHLMELARANKITAIKHYRQVTGAGLKESKDAVEALMTKHGFYR